MKWLKINNCTINMNAITEIDIGDYGITIFTKHYHHHYRVESELKRRTDTCLTPEFVKLKNRLEYIIVQDNQGKGMKGD